MTIAEKVKNVSIIDLAERMGFQVKKTGTKYYTLREHDSVIIDVEKNCFWRNSACSVGAKGHKGSPIDFAMEFDNIVTVKEAIYYIASMYGITADKDSSSYSSYRKPTYSSHVPKPLEKKTISFPKRANNNDHVVTYLCNTRMIDERIVFLFIDNGMLYQDIHNNCVFVSPDKKFVCKRSTGEKRFVQDLVGCDYERCFFFSETDIPKTIIVTESVIDAMSVMSYAIINSRAFAFYGNRAYLALSGTNKIPSLYYHLKHNTEVTNVLLALDRDNAGTKAVSSAIKSLAEQGFKGSVRFFFPPKGKDWNEYMQILSQQRKD